MFVTIPCCFLFPFCRALSLGRDRGATRPAAVCGSEGTAGDRAAARLEWPAAASTTPPAAAAWRRPRRFWASAPPRLAMRPPSRLHFGGRRCNGIPIGTRRKAPRLGRGLRSSSRPRSRRMRSWPRPARPRRRRDRMVRTGVRGECWNRSRDSK